MPENGTRRPSPASKWQTAEPEAQKSEPWILSGSVLLRGSLSLKASAYAAHTRRAFWFSPVGWNVSKVRRSYAIINARYEAYMPTIITTNYTDAELVRRLTPKDSGDPTTADATIDRLMLHIPGGPSDSLRLAGMCRRCGEGSGRSCRCRL